MKHLERALIGNNSIGFYIAIILIALLIQVVVLQAIILVVGLINPQVISLGSEQGSLAALLNLGRNFTLLALLFPFAVSLGILIFLVKVLHGRSFAEIVNGTKNIRWQRVVVGFASWFALITVATVVQLVLSPDNFIFQFELKRYIPLAVMTILLMPLQATFEEVLVRGYLAQGIGSYTTSRWLALFLPALFFTVLHLANPEIKEFGLWVMLTIYFFMAIIWGVVSILDDGIELSIGMHTANNMFISLFLTQRGAVFETDAVFELSQSNPYFELLSLLIIGCFLFFFFYKKYEWDIRVLNKKVEKPESPTDAVD